MKARLQYFDAEGNYTGGFDEMLFPADIDTHGAIMVVPDLHARITLLDQNNQVLAHLGDDPDLRKQVLAGNLRMRKQPERWEKRRLIHPHDA